MVDDTWCYKHSRH